MGSRPTTTIDLIDSAIGRLQSYQETLDYDWWDKFWASVRGESTDLGVLAQQHEIGLQRRHSGGHFRVCGRTVWRQFKQGQQISEEDLTNLQIS